MPGHHTVSPQVLAHAHLPNYIAQNIVPPPTSTPWVSLFFQTPVVILLKAKAKAPFVD